MKICIESIYLILVTGMSFDSFRVQLLTLGWNLIISFSVIMTITSYFYTHIVALTRKNNAYTVPVNV